MKAAFPDKTCARCGRRFSWRKKWARSWADVRYCSASCRRRKVGASDRALERRIMNVLEADPGREQALHELAGDAAEQEPLRQAARRLANDGHVLLQQDGRVIDPRDLHGPVMVTLPPNVRLH
jgi:hypothetical protein